jgi:hypothetical protein
MTEQAETAHTREDLAYQIRTGIANIERGQYLLDKALTELAVLERMEQAGRSTQRE